MDPRVAKLAMIKKIEQLSPEWFEARRNLITASSASNLLVRDDKTCDPYISDFNLHKVFDKNGRCCNPYSSANQFILDKCRGSKFKGSIATFHGQMYEDVAADLYRKRYNTEVMEFGILKHPKHSWLGASPDGITPGGIMLEIKCPYRRKITGIPPFYYWQQCQLQLEVCDLDECDFAEFEFTEFGTDEEYLDDTTIDREIHHKGMFIKIEKKNDEGGINPADNDYFYPKKELLDNDELLIKWRDANINDLRGKIKPEFKDTIIISPIMWKIFDISIVRIPRNKKWFEDVRPVFEKKWEEILYYRKNENYKHLLPKAKMDDLCGNILRLDIRENECILSDSDDE